MEKCNLDHNWSSKGSSDSDSSSRTSEEKNNEVHVISSDDEQVDKDVIASDDEPQVIPSESESDTPEVINIVSCQASTSGTRIFPGVNCANPSDSPVPQVCLKRRQSRNELKNAKKSKPGKDCSGGFAISKSFLNLRF